MTAFVVVSTAQIRQNPSALKPTPGAFKAPVAKVLGENQLYMGPYVSDALGESGLGLPGYEGIFQMGAVLPLDMVKPFEGGEVKAIRFGLCSSVTDGAVFVYPITQLSPLTLGEPLAFEDVDRTVAGWNQVDLTTPFTISTDTIVGLLLGYQYKQVKGSTDACYPISVVDEGTILASYTNAPGITTGWQDIGLSDYGNLSVQAIVENENFPPYNLVMSNLSAYSYAKISDGLTYMVNLSNYGIATLENYTIDVLIDNEVKSTINSPEALTLAGTTYQGVCPLDGVEPGTHTLTLRAVTVAGEEVTDGATLSANFAAYSASFPRQKHLVEQFTSTTCTYCPLGVNVLKAMKELCGETMEWAAIHTNIPSTGDPYVISKGTSLANYLGCNSNPSAAFDRFDGEMTGELVQGLGYAAQYAQVVAEMLKEEFFDNNPTPALASLKIEPTYDESTSKLAIKVTGQISDDFTTLYGSTMGLTVYVTEDSLVARQYNQGTWVNEYVHDNVVRAIPTAYNGDAITVTGNTSFEKGYVVTMNSAWKPEKMRVVALVHRRGAASTTLKEVINCEGVPVLSQSNVPGDVNGDGVVDVVDINEVINVMLGKSDIAAADVTGDGTADVEDINAIINIMLGN